MTFHCPVKCKSCGIMFEIPLEPLPIPNYPRKDLLENFQCGRCGDLTEAGKKFRKEWEDYLDKFR